jgi:hypothetical protein
MAFSNGFVRDYSQDPYLQHEANKNMKKFLKSSNKSIDKSVQRPSSTEKLEELLWRNS